MISIKPSIKLAIYVYACICPMFKNGLHAAVSIQTPTPNSTTHFIENKGQIHNVEGLIAENVRFVLERGTTKIFILREGGIAFQTEHRSYPKGMEELWKLGLGVENAEKMDSMMAEVRIETYRMDMVLFDANPEAEIIAEGKSLDYIHYYNRNVTQVHHYERVIFREIYPGIDWIIYTTEQGFKYDFLIQPGANPANIKMVFSGQEELRLDSLGQLIHGNRLAQFIEQTPISFQEGKPISSRFILKDSTLQFDVGIYDTTQALTIDPNRIWGSYYGGGGDDQFFTIKTDNNGNNYSAGITTSISNISLLGFQQFIGGQLDVFISKVDSSGSKIWGSYFGGLSNDIAFKLTIDKGLNIVICGYTNSFNNIFSNGFQQNLSGSNDGFVLKINQIGQIIWSSYFGGTGNDQCRSIATDTINNIFLVGTTDSNQLPASINLPAGGLDGFITKLDSNGNLIWSRYFGGSGSDGLMDIVNEKTGNILVTGYTTSSGISFNSFQSTLNGIVDAILAKFSPTGILVWCNYFGGLDGDYGYSLAFDDSSSIFICGETGGSLLPGTNQNSFQNSSNANTSGFIAKFFSNGQLNWATFIGGNTVITRLYSIKIWGNSIFMGGYTVSNITLGGWQSFYGGGGSDGFFCKFSKQGLHSWSSYYGGIDEDFVYEIEPTSNGTLFITGGTRSANNVSSDTLTNFLLGTGDAFIAKFKSCPTLNLNPLNSGPYCIGDGVILSAQGASMYNWSGPGGFSSNQQQVSIPNANPGMTGFYSVVGIDAFGCQSNDSVYVLVNPLPPVQIAGQSNYCEGENIQLTGQGNLFFSWTLPSGNIVNSDTLIINNAMSANSGLYIISGQDSNQCSNSDSIAISVTPYPIIQTNNIGTVCPGSTITLMASGGTSYLWSGPNGFSSSNQNPSLANAQYVNSGTYLVVVGDGNNCYDSAYVQVGLHLSPTINASNSGPHCSSDTIIFVATGAQSYTWSGPNGFLGSGDTVAIFNSTPIHSGNYLVSGLDTNGCSDTSSTVVLIHPNPMVQISHLLPLEFCQGEGTWLQASGANSYEWNTGDTSSVLWINQSGLFNFTGLDTNGCISNSSSLSTSVVPVPIWLTQPQNLIEQVGQTATLVAAAANAQSYQWESSISGAFQPIQDTGQYWGSQSQTLLVTNLNTINHNQQFRCIAYNSMCQDTSSVGTIYISGFQSFENKEPTNLAFPNPATNFINISVSISPPFEFTIADAFGRLVFIGSSNQQLFSLDVEKWPSGWYFFIAGSTTFPFLKMD